MVDEDKSTELWWPPMSYTFTSVVIFGMTLQLSRLFWTCVRTSVTRWLYYFVKPFVKMKICPMAYNVDQSRFICLPNTK